MITTFFNDNSYYRAYSKILKKVYQQNIFRFLYILKSFIIQHIVPILTPLPNNKKVKKRAVAFSKLRTYCGGIE